MNLISGDDLIDFAKTIKTKSDFEYFLKCLVFDYQQSQDEWENRDLLSYLQSLSAYVPSMEGYYKNMGEEIDTEKASWRVMAESLLAASIYGN